ncbi:hypothetical protein [Roseococcus sp. YIM B11640]|uniref:hypothetical protein n=1 Tax=Roseococcus sp. YIM B11640 TaxID=3133973 RepID=UPI003C7D3D32
MSAHDNHMAQELARKVRDARFARGHREAMAGFGGHDEASAGDRRRAWRKATPSPLRPARGVMHPNGDHRAGEVNEAPLPAWTGR